MEELEANARSAIAPRLDETTTGEVWEPPTDVGPIPIELMARARTVLLSHLDAIGHVEKLRDSTLAHLTAVRTVPDAAASDRSIYLDVTG